MTNECRAGNVRSSRLRNLIPPRGSIFTALCRVGVGSIPHLYSCNLTPDKTGLPEGGHTFEEFVQIIRHGRDFDHLHPTSWRCRHVCQLPTLSVQWGPS